MFSSLPRPIDPGHTENNWTPVISGDSTAGVYTYTKQVGRYTRDGNICKIYGRVAISAIGTPPTGNMRIIGLPLTSVNVADVFGGIWVIFVSNFNYAAAAMDLSGYILPNATAIYLIESFDNAASVESPAANFTNAAFSIAFRGEYQCGGT